MARCYLTASADDFFWRHSRAGVVAATANRDSSRSWANASTDRGTPESGGAVLAVDSANRRGGAISAGKSDDHYRDDDVTLIKSWVALALLGLTLFTSGVNQARAAEADPEVWGVYAHLVGTSWTGKFGTRATRWGEGNQMIEDDSSFGQSVITPGPTPGTLTLRLGSTGLHTFQGTIAADGSVLWIRDGRIKMPYRVLLRDGQLVEEAVKLSGSEVASVKREMRYQQVDGPRNASQSAPVTIPGPSSPGPVANVSTVDGAAATSMAVVPPTPTSVFGPIGAFIGKTFVGPTSTIEIYSEDNGDSLAIHWGVANSVLETGPVRGATRWLLRKTDQPGVLTVVEQASNMYGAKNFRAELRADGSLVAINNVPDSRSDWMHIFRVEGADVVAEFGYMSKGIFTGPGPFELSRSERYQPMTQARLAEADANLAYQIAETAQQKAEERAAQIEAQQSSERAFQSFMGALSDQAQGMAEVDSGGYAEAQANLDATVANINAAAADERQQQALAAQQEQARAAEANREQLAENARWVAEKEQAAAEHQSGQAEAAAAREAQLREQQVASEQRRAAAEVQRRNAEQTAAIERQRVQAAALANPPQVAARPAAATEPASSPSSGYQPAQASSGAPATSGPVEMFVFFTNLGGKTVAFEGPVALTRAEGRAMKARLAAEAPGRYGAGATIREQSMGGGYCAFVYQRPGEATYIMGSDNNLATTIQEAQGMVQNLKAVIHHDVVCPGNT